MPPEASPVTRTLDRVGVIGSVGCAIHCMVAPALILAAPALGGWWVHPSTHLAIAALVLPVAAMALWRGYGIHGRGDILAWGGLGIVLVLIGVVLPYLSPSAASACGTCTSCCPTMLRDAETGSLSLHIPPASIVTMLGGGALITAHIGNLRSGGASCCAKPSSADDRVSGAGNDA